MPPARLLDLTRLLSRLGKGQPTGVDRVEAAYLSHLLTLPSPVFALIRSKLGYLLLDQGGMVAFQKLITGQAPLPHADFLSRVTRRNDPMLARAETALRGVAIARGARLRAMLQSHLPNGFSYLNTGHANLGTANLTAIKAAGGKIVVLIHDTIPLDYPEFTRRETIARFDQKLAATATHADLVIHSASTTRAQTESHFQRHGRVPAGLVAPLGISVLHPGHISPREKPYFITLGTIEPRKNHAFLLDLWQKLHDTLPEDEVPHLLILGRRGWASPELLHRLDTLPFRNRTVFELPNLPDDQVAGFLVQSRALLFPSFVEGYGLPPLEAASLGVAVVVPPLPVYQETLGDYPVYAALEDSYSWLETIIRLKDGVKVQDRAAHGQKDSEKPVVRIPQWQEHFHTVLSIA